MALRSPIYLDTETLFSQAEYHDLPVPLEQEIVEKTVSKRTGGGKVGLSGIGVDASRGTDVEYQSTYSLKPKEKASVSKVIDALIADAEAVKVNPGGDVALIKDDVVEIEGDTRITTASMAGKMFFMLRRLLDNVEGGIDSITNLSINDLPVSEQFSQVYLRNELLPIPILLELTGSDLQQKVYVNVRPDHFLDEASANRVEGNLRVLGTVSQLVPGGPDGYLSAEEWLLHGWEHLMRRFMMTNVDEFVSGMTSHFDLALPTEDVHAFIAGPAVVVNAIAIY